jgi:U4/U6 small nuclear ribonucleoprotein PRP31
MTACNKLLLEVVDSEYGLGPVEADPEYLLIVEANNLAAEIDSETNTIHKFAR